MSERGRELVTPNKPTIVAEPLFDTIVMEDGQSGRRLADSANTDQGGRREALCEGNNLLDQVVTSKEDPRWRWWRLPKCAKCKYKILDLLAVEIADLF